MLLLEALLLEPLLLVLLFDEPLLFEPEPDADFFEPLELPPDLLGITLLPSGAAQPPTRCNGSGEARLSR